MGQALRVVTADFKKSDVMIRREIIWGNDNHCKIDDINFQVEAGRNLYSGSSSNENSFIVGKSRRMLAREYFDLSKNYLNRGKKVTLLD